MVVIEIAIDWGKSPPQYLQTYSKVLLHKKSISKIAVRFSYVYVKCCDVTNFIIAFIIAKIYSIRSSEALGKYHKGAK